MSHTPADGRQTVVAGANASAGQVSLEPVQVSATSQVPAEFRHVVPLVLKVQFVLQQEPKEPLALPWSHCSPTEPSIEPLPQREVNVTVTKWPSFACVRPGEPG